MRGTRGEVKKGATTRGQRRWTIGGDGSSRELARLIDGERKQLEEEGGTCFVGS